MKIICTALLLSSITLAACGSDSNSSAKAIDEHFFDQAYECHREREVTSKKTGKTRTVKYLSYYSPEQGWRIDLTDVGSKSLVKVANLYTPTARYDGAYKELEGVVTKVKFSTAWPHKETKPNISLGRLSKTKKKDCAVLKDSSVFNIGYLDTLEVMGQ
jgi:hypothetical protein